jgi:1-acyl-sn-glycerol-3-phosphate acyltransferase
LDRSHIQKQGRSDLFTIRAIGDALKQGDMLACSPKEPGHGLGACRIRPGNCHIGSHIQSAALSFISKASMVSNPAGRTRNERQGVLAGFPPITPDSIGEMSVQELHERLLADIGFSYRTWQEKNQLPMSPKKRPKALNWFSISAHSASMPARLSVKALHNCTHCHYSASLDPYDKLHTTQGTHHFDVIAYWHAGRGSTLQHLTHLRSASS